MNSTVDVMPIESPQKSTHWLIWLEKAVFVITVMYHTAVFYPFLGGGFTSESIDTAAETVEQKSSILLSLLQWLLFFSSVGFGALRWRSFLHALTHRRLLWGVVILVVMSSMWSELPDVSSKRGIILLFSTLTGIYAGFRFPIREQMRLIAIALGITALMNFGFTLALPQFGLESGVHSGAWRGLLVQKNGLARFAVLSTLCLLLTKPLANRKWRRWALWGLLISAVLVLLSTSKTGLLVMILLITLTRVYRWMRWRSPLVIPALLAILLSVAIVIIAVFGHQEAVAKAIGRDITLTGRTELWAASLEMSAERPWLGYGYKAFWQGNEGPSANIWYRMFWIAPNGHNGAVDMLLDIGWLGMLSFAGSLLMGFWRAITWMRLCHNPEGLWPICYLTFLLFYNVTESSLIIEPANIFWFLYVVVTTTILIQPLPITSRQRPRSQTLQSAQHHPVV